MAGNELAPIIIKRKKKGGGDAHHGGAWKVAYADFVTAMMAFFMLMWLLNATTEKQRKGIADYFNPTVPVNRISGGGDGAFGGDSVFSESTLAQNGLGASIRLPAEQKQARGMTGTDSTSSDNSESLAKEDEFGTLVEQLSGSGGESMVSEQLLRHVVTRQTDEGLIIELHDLPGEPLFSADSAVPTELLKDLLGEMTAILGIVTNKMAIGGHVAARPVVVVGRNPWVVSSERADATRELLVEAGFDQRRLQRIAGFADRKPVTANGMAARNSRVELVLLRRGN